ncbi:MAG: transcriptional regulator [Gomphosphaeria aponina SAG 52.96 = DSM 107014]|uniref:Transcriptional regulator n=1 Tax=Gomphosphaeria aponina SAG 52.96 = DSM 107014 TaxID=1521640 RepID=A0A941GTZ3_9CHRO|nr:transcriptional regulator [Gomphosphaeria aponina SAG 52.96 = DSM 107014]
MTKPIGKKTLTFNSEVYNHLLCKYQPQIITNEEQNQKFLTIVEELMSHSTSTPEEDMILALLVKLIEDFEEKIYSLNLSTPHSRLLHLMEARGVEKIDLFKILSKQGISWEILDGQLEITTDKAKILADFFHVNPSLFLET